MIKHTFMILWRSKIKNTVLMVQFFLAFIAIFFLLDKAIKIYDEYNTPLGYELDNRIGGGFSNLPDTKTAELHQETYNMMKAAMDQINSHEAVIHGGYVGRTPYAGNWSSNGYTTNALSIDGVKAFDLDFIDGANFNEDMELDPYRHVIINEAAWKELSASKESLVSKHFVWPSDTVEPDTKEPDQQMFIAGVVKDYNANGRFNFRTNEKAIFYLASFNGVTDNFESSKNNIGRNLNAFTIHFDRNYRNKIEKVVYDAFKTHMPDINFSLNFFDDLDNRTAKFEWLQFGMFLFICLVLFSIIIVGVIGVMSENLSKRLKEIGIRVALGSTEQQIVKQFISEMGILTTLAILLGASLISMIMGFNIVVLSIASLVLILVVSICTYLPTNKTARIKPNIALHYE